MKSLRSISFTLWEEEGEGMEILCPLELSLLTISLFRIRGPVGLLLGWLKEDMVFNGEGGWVHSVYLLRHRS